MAEFFKTIHLDATNTDFLCNWRLSNIFSVSQEVAGDHAAVMGSDRKTMWNNHMFWAIVRSNVEIYEYPKILQSVDIKTWAGVPKRTLCPRYFEFFVDKKLVAAMSTIWMLIDLHSRKVLDPKTCNIALPQSCLAGQAAMPKKILFDDNNNNIVLNQRKCLYSDVDLNKHMNNAKYVDWIVDSFDFQWHNKFQISQLSLNYINEVAPDETVTFYNYSTNEIKENQFFFKGQSKENKIFFNAQGTFNQK